MAIVAFYEGRTTHQSFTVMAEPVAGWRSTHKMFKNVAPTELDDLVDQVGSDMLPKCLALVGANTPCMRGCNNSRMLEHGHDMTAT